MVSYKAVVRKNGQIKEAGELSYLLLLRILLLGCAVHVLPVIGECTDVQHLHGHVYVHGQICVRYTC